MKTILLIFTGSLFFMPCVAQEKEGSELIAGRVTYEEKVKLEIKLEGDVAQYASMLPKERKTEKVLSFNSSSTLFTDGNNNAGDVMAEAGQTEGVRIRMVGSGSNKTFVDLVKGVIIDQRDFMNRIFLVESQLPELAWKMTGNQKMILNYQCMEAFRTDTAGIKTVAWFTPAIAVKAGPALLSGLPGLILEADINNGSRTYVATGIELLDSRTMKIEIPREGKTVTEAEYQILVAEKMKEMGIEQGAQGGGSGTHMRIVIKQ